MFFRLSSRGVLGITGGEEPDRSTGFILDHVDQPGATAFVVDPFVGDNCTDDGDVIRLVGDIDFIIDLGTDLDIFLVRAFEGVGERVV